MTPPISQVKLFVSCIRAARGALGWSQSRLAKEAGISKVSLARLEAGTGSPRFSTVTRIREALTNAGIKIVEDQPSGGYTVIVSQRALDDGGVTEDP